MNNDANLNFNKVHFVKKYMQSSQRVSLSFFHIIYNLHFQGYYIYSNLQFKSLFIATNNAMITKTVVHFR